MTWKECLFEIIIPIISSGGIAFLLWCLDRKREQKREKEHLEREAREILINNGNEKEYLFLAQFGTFLNPVEQHSRTIYNVFNCCPEKLQKEILKQVKI